MNKVLVMFGGVSSEHEVSIITGLQVVQNMDKQKYEPLAFKIAKNGQFYAYPGLSKISDYKSIKPVKCLFARKADGTYIVTEGVIKKSYKIDCAYLAFHGGNGEGGAVQGMLDVYDLPYTSTSTESSVLCMNKAVTKEILRNYGVQALDDVTANEYECINHSKKLAERVESKLGLPVIVKPVHLGSTIGISVAHTKVELEKSILEAGHLDTEVLFEKFVDKKAEYNVSVRRDGVEIITSEIERPLSQNEILTFKDKYSEGGSKKTGGMASLARELPAKIDKKLADMIIESAKKTYAALRCSGNVRIDFIQDAKGEIFILEVNPIPGSVAFYLWEASGVSFRDQITASIEQAILEKRNRDSKRFDYESDIVEQFVNVQ